MSVTPREEELREEETLESANMTPNQDTLQVELRRSKRETKIPMHFKD